MAYHALPTTSDNDFIRMIFPLPFFCHNSNSHTIIDMHIIATMTPTASMNARVYFFMAFLDLLCKDTRSPGDTRYI